MTNQASEGGNSDGEDAGEKKTKGPSIQCMIGGENSLEQLRELHPQ